MNESETPLTQALLDQFGTNGNTDFECYDKLIDHSRTLELRNRKLVEALNVMVEIFGKPDLRTVERSMVEQALAEQKEEKP